MQSTIPQTMRACQFSAATGGLERNLAINPSAALPSSANSLRAGQTLVKIHYSALNPVDYKLPELPLVGSFAISKPAVPCADFAGTVAAKSRQDLRVGQRVYGKLEPPQFGALAEYAVVGYEGTVPLPDEVSFEQAGCVGVAGLTAYQTLASAKAGDKVFINGLSGGTGTFGIQIARAKGCYVVGTCSTGNVDFCKELGANEVIDYKSEDVISTLKRGGRMFDLVVDYVGQTDLYWQSASFLKPAGKFVCVGAQPSLATLKSFLAIFLTPRFLGGWPRTFEFLTCKVNAAQYADIAKMMAEGKVKSVIQQSYALENSSDAFIALKSGRTRGKLAIKVSD